MWLGSIRKALDQDHPVAAGLGEHRARLVAARRQRLFTEDMLTRPRRSHRPFRVQRVRERNVDRVDRRIGQQFRIGAVSTRNAHLLRKSSCLVEGSAGDCRHQHRPGRPGTQHELARDGRCAQDPDPEWSVARLGHWPSLWEVWVADDTAEGVRDPVAWLTQDRTAAPRRRRCSPARSAARC